MKITRMNRVWILKSQGRCFYFPSLADLMETVRKIVNI